MSLSDIGGKWGCSYFFYYFENVDLRCKLKNQFKSVNPEQQKV